MQSTALTCLRQPLLQALKDGDYCPQRSYIDIVKKIAETKVASEVSHFHLNLKNANFAYSHFDDFLDKAYFQKSDRIAQIKPRVYAISNNSLYPTEYKQIVQDMASLEMMYQLFQELAYMKLTRLVRHEHQLQPKAFLKTKNLENLLTRIVSKQSTEVAISVVNQVKEIQEPRKLKTEI